MEMGGHGPHSRPGPGVLPRRPPRPVVHKVRPPGPWVPPHLPPLWQWTAREGIGPGRWVTSGPRMGSGHCSGRAGARSRTGSRVRVWARGRTGIRVRVGAWCRARVRGGVHGCPAGGPRTEQGEAATEVHLAGAGSWVPYVSVAIDGGLEGVGGCSCWRCQDKPEAPGEGWGWAGFG